MLSAGEMTHVNKGSAFHLMRSLANAFSMFHICKRGGAASSLLATSSFFVLLPFSLTKLVVRCSFLGGVGHQHLQESGEHYSQHDLTILPTPPSSYVVAYTAAVYIPSLYLVAIRAFDRICRSGSKETFRVCADNTTTE